MSRCAGEHGVASVLVLVLTCVLLALAWAATTFVGVVVAHREAQSAADLAALAAASEITKADHGCGTAAEVATANRASLVSCQVEGRTVTVEVEVKLAGRVSGVHARARAGPQ